jgi:hypothetical protein
MYVAMLKPPTVDRHGLLHSCTIVKQHVTVKTEGKQQGRATNWLVKLQPALIALIEKRKSDITSLMQLNTRVLSQLGKVHYRRGHQLLQEAH